MLLSSCFAYFPRPAKRGARTDALQGIAQRCADVHGLTRRQTFEKHEATGEDLVFILHMFWLRPDLIPCDPDARLDFHISTLIGGVAGFRPGERMSIFYDQIEMKVVRDPEDASRTNLVATITMFHNKQRPDQVRTSQDDM